MDIKNVVSLNIGPIIVDIMQKEEKMGYKYFKANTFKFLLIIMAAIVYFHKFFACSVHFGIT